MGRFVVVLAAIVALLRAEPALVFVTVVSILEVAASLSSSTVFLESGSPLVVLVVSCIAM